MEVASNKIRVTAVNPVASETGFFKGALGADAFADPNRKGLIQGIPLGRLAEPLDVARAVHFLASEDAGFLTEVSLDVDGGRSISCEAAGGRCMAAQIEGFGADSEPDFRGTALRFVFALCKSALLAAPRRRSVA